MAVVVAPSSSVDRRLVAAALGATGAAAVAVLSRWLGSRENGKHTPEAISTSSRVREVMLLVSGGVTTTAVTAALTWKLARGIPRGLLKMGLVGQGVVLLSVVTPALLAMALPARKKKAKLTALAAFHVIDGIVFSTFGYFGGAILRPAAVLTGSLCMGLGTLAAASPPGWFLPLATPLSVGLSAMTVANLLSLVFKSSGFLAALADFKLYGGLALFSCYLLYDIHHLVRDARRRQNDEDFDAVRHSLNVYLDITNLFVRFVQLLARSRKKDEDEDK